MKNQALLNLERGRSWSIAAGVLYRSRDGMRNFEHGGNPFQKDSLPTAIRHVAVILDDPLLSVYYSRIGDTPECILLSKIELTNEYH